MTTVLMRFAMLKARGIVNSWPQLKRLQRDHDFPLGRMLSPNIRAWTEAEIDKWIASRPVENTRPLQGEPKRRRAAAESRTAAAAAAAESDAGDSNDERVRSLIAPPTPSSASPHRARAESNATETAVT
jgi:predicted DNA-binding transcriptional regulator AlpA